MMAVPKFAPASSRTPDEELRDAARQGDAATVRALLNAGVDVNAKRQSDGWTALHCVSWNGQASVVPILLEAGADVYAKNAKDVTALDVARECNKPDVIALLESAIAKAMAAEAKARAEAKAAMAPSFYFASSDFIMETTETTLPRMQTLRKAGALTKLTIKLSDAIRRVGTDSILFVSHRWEDQSSPDTAGKQLKAIQAYLRSHPEIKYVWYDYWSMPQRQDKDTDDRSPAEMAEFAYMLSCIADLYLTTRYSSYWTTRTSAASGP